MPWRQPASWMAFWWAATISGRRTRHWPGLAFLLPARTSSDSQSSEQVGQVALSSPAHRSRSRTPHSACSNLGNPAYGPWHHTPNRPCKVACSLAWASGHLSSAIPLGSDHWGGSSPSALSPISGGPPSGWVSFVAPPWCFAGATDRMGRHFHGLGLGRSGTRKLKEKGQGNLHYSFCYWTFTKITSPNVRPHSDHRWRRKVSGAWCTRYPRTFLWRPPDGNHRG